MDFGLLLEVIKVLNFPRFGKWCINKWGWRDISLFFI